MTAYDEALAKRQQVRSKQGCNPNTEFRAGWEAAMRAVGARTEWGVHYPKYIGSGRLEIHLSEQVARFAVQCDPEYPEEPHARLITRMTTEWENAS